MGLKQISSAPFRRFAGLEAKRRVVNARPALENVPNGDDYAAVAAVRSPLVKESSVRHRRIRNSELTRIEGIVEIGSKLKLLVLSDARVLQNAKINVVDAVGTKNISTCASDALPRAQRLEEGVSVGADCSTKREKLSNRHA